MTTSSPWVVDDLKRSARSGGFLCYFLSPVKESRPTTTLMLRISLQ